MNTLESVAIRRGHPGDASALQAVMQASSAGAILHSRDWHHLLESPAHFVYAAEDTNIFGFVCAGCSLASLPGYEQAGEIVGLFVTSGYQRHGMGTKLLVRGISVLKRRAFSTAMAWLPDTAPHVVQVFSSLGFVAAGPTRITNTPSGEIHESAYLLGLDAFF